MELKQKFSHTDEHRIKEDALESRGDVLHRVDEVFRLRLVHRGSRHPPLNLQLVLGEAGRGVGPIADDAEGDEVEEKGQEAEENEDPHPGPSELC